MRVAVYEGVKSIRLQERPTPQAAPGEAIVRVKYCGICGTDAHGYTDGRWAPGTVFGHEVAGTITEIGNEVTGFKVGERVAVAPYAPCGECYFCRNGQYNICVHFYERCIGLSPANDGGFAEYVRVPFPKNMLYKLPDNVSFEDAVLVEPMAVALGMVRKSRFRIGDNVAVVGAGMVGLSGIQFLRMAGARTITAIDPLARKRDLALQLGVDLALNPAEEGAALQKEAMAMYGGDGKGMDIVYECSGGRDAISLGLSLVKSGGQFIQVGGAPLQGDGNIVRREIELKGSLGYTEEFGLCIDFMARGKMNTKSLISDIITLDDVVEKGFERLAMPNDLVRIIVAP